MVGELVSCLMITQDPHRFSFVCRSVNCYLNQTYPHKELIVCCFGPVGYRRRLQSYLSGLDRPDIHVYFPHPARTLGEMRNESVSLATGKYICQWDDDDLYHPDRLALQIAEMERARCDVSYLQDQLHLFTDSGELYWVNWAPDLVPNTLLCSRHILQRFRYPPKSKREDGDLRDVLRDNLPIAGVRGMGYLYIYTYHGRNTYDIEHHRYIHIGHDATYMTGREAIVRRNLEHFDLRGVDVKLSTSTASARPD